MLSRAWRLVLFLCSPLLLYCSSLCVYYSVMATLIFILFIFLIAMFIVYFDYISSIVTLLLLSSCICSYSVYPKVHRVDDLHYVGVMLRYVAYLRVLPDVLGRVVDREGDYYSFIESFVVHPLCRTQSHRRWRLHPKSLSSWCSLCVDNDIVVMLTMIVRCNCTN
jgi:hypothetical protein